MTITADAIAINEGLAVGGKVARLTLNNYDTLGDAISWFRIQPDVDGARSNNQYFNRPVPVPGSNPPQADLTLAQTLDFDAGLRTVIAGLGVSFASNRLPVDEHITFQVTNINEPPTFSVPSYTSQPLMPGSPMDTVVVASTASDPEGSLVSYTLSGAASSYLRVAENGNIVVSGTVPQTYGATVELSLQAEAGARRHLELTLVMEAGVALQVDQTLLWRGGPVSPPPQPLGLFAQDQRAASALILDDAPPYVNEERVIALLELADNLERAGELWRGLEVRGQRRPS
jgi:hypothetical protein